MKPARHKKLAATLAFALGVASINIHFNTLKDELRNYTAKTLSSTWSHVDVEAPHLDATKATIEGGAECANLYGYSPLISRCFKRGYKAESDGGFCFAGPEGILYERYPLIRAKISNLHNILVLGGSTSANAYSLDLEKLLNDESSKRGSDQRFNVINLAISGYTSLDNQLSYEHFVKVTEGKVPFDGVTVLAGWNDIGTGTLFSEEEHEAIELFKQTGDLSHIKRLGGWFEKEATLKYFSERDDINDATPNPNRYARSVFTDGFYPNPYYEHLKAIFEDAKKRGAFTAVELPADAYDCQKPVTFMGARRDVLVNAADAKAIIREGLPRAAKKLYDEAGAIVISHRAYFDALGPAENCKLFGWIDNGDIFKGDELHTNDLGAEYHAKSTFEAIKPHFFN